MTPTDTRHGSNAGYVAGCRRPCCVTARNRFRKRVSLAHLAGHEFFTDETAVDDVMAPWLAMGLSRTAISAAAGLRYDKPLTGRVRTTSYRALQAVTEDDFGGRAMVYADLTRTRIYSLMAAGHQLQAMPLSPQGVWRTRLRVRVDFARTIRDHYRSLEFTMGDSARTASQARNRGWAPPLSWDDPDTLAWPLGSLQPLHTTQDVASDEAVVLRILAGEALPATASERSEVVTRWVNETGRPLNDLERLTGWNVARLQRETRGAA